MPFTSRFGQTGIFLLLASLLSGCAALSPLGNKPANPTETRSSLFPNLEAPYNKPYKKGGITYYPIRSSTGYRETGNASWYGHESGNRTAMGTRFVPHNLTAAHRTLPLPSRVRVTNLSNGRHVDVTVNDRGPFRKDRIIDLSQGAAKIIGLRGVSKVRVESLENRIGQK